MIGATDSSLEGQWVDFNNDQLNFTNWKLNEPNDNHGNEDYVGFTLYTPEWVDRNGAVKYPILCEKDLGKFEPHYL